ncbi:MAG: PQQ-binding-like beta-propeller repeat protein, partial [Candidatus Dormibacteraceae bacterium]
MRRTNAVALIALLAILCAVPHSAVSLPARTAAASTGWTTYHHDGTRDGYDASAAAFPASGNPTASWTTSLDGDVYAEPLALNSVVYAATENNSIYALDEITGRALWQWHQFASQPDPATAAGCGNINPVGITGTPVIDPAAGIIYAVGLVAATGGGTKFQIFAVHTGNGSPVAGFPLDIGQPNPIYQEQRAALALSPAETMVYVAFGGWAGDCQPYHPLVVGVPVGANLGQAQLVYQPQTAGQGEAGIWGASG